MCGGDGWCMYRGTDRVAGVGRGEAWGARGERGGRWGEGGRSQAACSHARQAARTLASVSARFQLAGLVKNTTAATWLGLGLGL